MDISYLDSSEEYEVELYRGTAKQKFTVNPITAYEILTDIYNEMYNYELNAYMPLDCVKKNLTFEQLVKDALGQNGGWGFFKEKAIFSPYKDLGYTKFNYDEISSQMKDMLKRLVIYLVKEEA